jgi:hypothetical protein
MKLLVKARISHSQSVDRKLWNMHFNALVNYNVQPFNALFDYFPSKISDQFTLDKRAMIPSTSVLFKSNRLMHFSIETYFKYSTSQLKKLIKTVVVKLLKVWNYLGPMVTGY